MEYYTYIKKNEIMSSAATWMDLETVWVKSDREATWMDLETVWVKSDREAETTYDIPYTQNLKSHDTNKLIYKTGTDSQT